MNKLTALYFIIALVIFGEATQHYKWEYKYARVIPATVSAALWPMYISYRVFNKD